VRANSGLLLQMLPNASERVDVGTEANAGGDCLPSLTDASHGFASDSMFLLGSGRAVVYIVGTLAY